MRGQVPEVQVRGKPAGSALVRVITVFFVAVELGLQEARERGLRGAQPAAIVHDGHAVIDGQRGQCRRITGQ